MSTLESFRSDVEAFLKRTGMSPSAFGKAAVGDANFVLDLREGRSVGLRLVDKVAAFMRTQPQAERAQ